MNSRPRLELAMVVLLLVIFSVGLGLSFTFLARAEIYPRVISSIGVAITSIELGLYLFTKFRKKSATTPSSSSELMVFIGEVRGIAPYVLWILFYFLLIWIIGLIIASGLFTLAFLWLVGKTKFYQAVIGALVATVAAFLIFDLLSLALPDALYDPFLEFRNFLRLPF